jgi:hypothetical protein
MGDSNGCSDNDCTNYLSICCLRTRNQRIVVDSHVSAIVLMRQIKGETRRQKRNCPGGRSRIFVEEVEVLAEHQDVTVTVHLPRRLASLDQYILASSSRHAAPPTIAMEQSSFSDPVERQPKGDKITIVRAFQLGLHPLLIFCSSYSYQVIRQTTARPRSA